MLFLLSFLLFAQSASNSGAPYPSTPEQPVWRNVEFTVVGWDWSLPFKVKRELSSLKLSPLLTAYLSIEKEKNISTSPDAWCYLGKRTPTHGKVSTGDKHDPSSASVVQDRISKLNFEKWLYLCEGSLDGISGASRKRLKISALKGKDKDPKKLVFLKIMVNDLLEGVPASQESMKEKGGYYTALKARSIALALHDNFLIDGPHRVAVKISYFDKGRGKLVLVYNKIKTKKVTLKNSGRLLTTTFLLEKAQFRGYGIRNDIILEGEGVDIVINFIRIIKL